jgi:hypothetical protein
MHLPRYLSIVMAGLDPAIYELFLTGSRVSWMPGTSPGMTGLKNGWVIAP